MKRPVAVQQPVVEAVPPQLDSDAAPQSRRWIGITAAVVVLFAGGAFATYRAIFQSTDEPSHAVADAAHQEPLPPSQTERLREPANAGEQRVESGTPGEPPVAQDDASKAVAATIQEVGTLKIRLAKVATEPWETLRACESFEPRPSGSVTDKDL